MAVRDAFSVRGQRVLVTGAAMGIGFGIAERFADGGASVLIADVDGGAAQAAAGKLAGLDGPTWSIALDVAGDDAGPAALKAATELMGGLDVLINNAGIYPLSPVSAMDLALFDRVIAVNLRGAVFLAKAAFAQMVAQGTGGSIVNVASIDSVHPSMVGLAAYDTSKGGLLMFTKALALEAAPHGVRVNAIAPGAIATEGTSQPLAASGMTAEETKAMQDAFIAQIPMARMGEPDDIATVAVFLASPASAYMTGELLVVDGGRLLK